MVDLGRTGAIPSSERRTPVRMRARRVLEIVSKGIHRGSSSGGMGGMVVKLCTTTGYAEPAAAHTETAGKGSDGPGLYKTDEKGFDFPEIRRDEALLCIVDVGLMVHRPEDDRG